MDEVPAHIDVIGWIAGVVDRAKEALWNQDERFEGINVAEHATDLERFANERAEGHWRLREAFEPHQIITPNDDELMQELTSVKDKVVHSNGTTKMEENEEAEHRLGKSPALADSPC